MVRIYFYIIQLISSFLKSAKNINYSDLINIQLLNNQNIIFQSIADIYSVNKDSFVLNAMLIALCI